MPNTETDSQTTPAPLLTTSYTAVKPSVGICLKVHGYFAGMGPAESPVAGCQGAAVEEMGDLGSSVLPASH